MLTSIEIGNKIAEARKAKNLSQAALAQQLSLSPQAVGKWERGESLPDIVTLDRLARTLDVDLNYFSENFASAPIQSPAPIVEVSSASDSEPKKRGWNMSEGSWVDADFSGLLMGSNHVEQCDFTDANLDGSRIRSSHIANSQFRNVSLRGVSFNRSHIQDCDLTGADLTNAEFELSTLQKSIVTDIVWSHTRFHITQFSDVVLSGNIDNCSFEGCSFTRVTFQDATLTRTFFKNKSFKKVKFDKCRRGSPIDQLDGTVRRR